MRLTISASASASRSASAGFSATSRCHDSRSSSHSVAPAGLGIQRDHAARHGRDHEEREPDRDLERRPLLVGQREVVEPDRAVADGAELGLARAHRPAGLADAQDPPLVEMQQVAVRGGERERAQLALLVGSRPPARRRGRGRRLRQEAAEARHQVRPATGRQTAVLLPVRRHAATATLHSAAVLAQQRHRLELEPVLAHAAARQRQLEAARARRAVQRAAAEVAVVERRAAARAAVAVGEQVAGDVGDHERLARPPTCRSPRRASASRGPRASSSRSTGGPPPDIGSSKPPSAGAGAVTPSTSIPSRSGAASCSACSIASSIVDADAGQPSQEPSSRSRATPSSIPSSSTLPPWDSMYGRTLSSASRTRVSSGDRVEAVDQHQAGHDAVLGEPVAQGLASAGSSAIVSKMRSRPSP